jgi:hypothetical protein
MSCRDDDAVLVALDRDLGVVSAPRLSRQVRRPRARPHFTSKGIKYFGDHDMGDPRS